MVDRGGIVGCTRVWWRVRQTRYRKNRTKRQARGWTSDILGIADIVCQSGIMIDGGYKAQTLVENCHDSSPRCLGICGAVEAVDSVSDSGEERSKDWGD